MPEPNKDLHGNVPDTADIALVLIDVVNDFEFEGGEDLFKQALPVAQNIAKLKQRAKQANIPAIYVNDNFGKWRSDFKKLIMHCLEDDVRGKPIAELLKPDEDDYFVLKPKHSGFFSTTLNILLDYLKAKSLIIAGYTGNICVLFTASDAYMRDFRLIVPADCVASYSVEENEYALRQMRDVLKADTRPSTELDLAGLSEGV
jgi:nicotinamidase-related amidase